MNKEIKINDAAKIEIRGATNEPKTLVGYAACFEQKTNIGPFDEVVSRGAFDEALSDKSLDVVALFNHDGQPLGRTSNGTLKLSTDSYGLRYEVQCPNTQLGHDVLELVKRGDISASSFAFSMRGDNGDEWNYRSATPLRTLKNLNIHDVSPVTTPAYASTTVSARSKQIPENKKGIIETSDVETCERQIKELLNSNSDVRFSRYR